MTPQIYQGSQPKSQLFFDLQSFITENGGRLRLAEKLEIELIKCNRFKKRKIKHFKHYSRQEDYLIINRLPVINRQPHSIRARRWLLKRKGLL